MEPHHIGYLVKSIEKAKQKMLALGYTLEQDTVLDQYRGIYICFMANKGYRVELIEPADDTSVVKSLVKKIGVSPYHICYQSNAFEQDVENCRKQGYVPMGEPQEAPAIDHLRAAFLFHPQMGIIEIVGK